jgi:hypothetical protein
MTRNTVPFGYTVAILRCGQSASASLSTGDRSVTHIAEAIAPSRSSATFDTCSSILTQALPLV